MTWVRWLPSVLLLVPLLVSPLKVANDARIRDLSAPVAFRLLDWETEELTRHAGRLWSGLFGDGNASAPTEAAATLQRYFANKQAARDPHDRPAAETALEQVVGAAYRNAGVTRSEPFPMFAPRLFPPVLITLTSPPNVLVIAPRTELRVINSTVLGALDVPAQERLEVSADSTGISSLVAPIGGLATYPSMVLEEDSAERVLNASAHEWMHQYLIFYPLGQGYWSSQQTREINETTADLVGQEVGGKLAEELGLTDPVVTPPPPQSDAAPTRRPAFDFRAFMRDTRAQTESLLRDGRVDDAEAYMRARRDELTQHGYQIRKLNQAYFALYGSYGDGFAASPTNPIPDLLHRLREKSGSLADFIFAVRSITTVDELRQAAG
jgi:hypothetical protein